MKKRGSITKDLPFLEEDCRNEIEYILNSTNNYWDFAETLSKKTVEPSCHPNLVYLSMYHASRLQNSKAARRIIDAHPELPIPYPFFLPTDNDYETDVEIIEKAIELNQNPAITFYLLMRHYRVTGHGIPEEDKIKNRIEEFLANNEKLRLHGADYYGHTGFRLKGLGAPEASFDLMMKALELARESGDKWHQASLLTLIAEVTSQYKKGKESYATARKYLSEAMDLCREIGDKAGIATALQNMAVFAYSRWELGEAFDCQLESALIQGDLGEVSAGAASNLAGLYAASGDQKSAFEWIKIVEEKEKELGPYAHFPMVELYMSLGKMKEAEKSLSKASELTMALGLETALGRLYRVTGKMELMRGDLESAMDYSQRALEINERASRQLRVRACLLDLAKIELEMFSPTKQNRKDEHSGPWMKRLEDEVNDNDIPGVYARLLLMKAELRMKQGRHDEAEEILDSVISFTDNRVTRFVHKEALQMKEKWVEEGVLPLEASRKQREIR
ncbi:MAG: hypothetical protein ACFFDM_10965 [Candidatus Thorarchaeota archaeon]